MARQVSVSLVAAGLLSLAGVAHAAEVVLQTPATVNLSAWTYGSGNGVNVASPTYNGQGGGFKGVLSNAGIFNDASFETYCVELGQVFNWNVTYNNYKVIKGDTYSLWAGNPATAGKLGQLMTYVDTLGTLSSVQSTGVQLAIWELVYEVGGNSISNPYSLDTGLFMNTPTTPNVFANTLLSNFGNTVSLYNVDVLKSETNQDFLVLTVVPEPEAYGLALAGMGVVAFAMRRRKADKTA